jgi:predicted metal-binding transcription factor (methanogenesis marker protein 9)
MAFCLSIACKMTKKCPLTSIVKNIYNLKQEYLKSLKYLNNLLFEHLKIGMESLDEQLWKE